MTQNSPMNDEDLFRNSFHEWLEKHGVKLEAYRVTAGWEAIIDLNTLKSAMIHRDASRDQQIATAARIDENERWHSAINHGTGYIGKRKFKERIATLNQTHQEKEKS